MFDLVIIGGGAAGFYTAIHVAEADPSLHIAILEKGKKVLQKVRISGGGRCNVTHAVFDPKELARHYPRGRKELLGPLYTHATSDTVAFFEQRGVRLKIEADGRMFPISDTSQTIIDCFLNEAQRLGIQVFRHSRVNDLRYDTGTDPRGFWEVMTIKNTYRSKKILIASGSNEKIWELLHQLGHTIVPGVPSLFTFNIDDPRLSGIQGLSTLARVEIPSQQPSNPKITISLKSLSAKKPLFVEEGPVLVTHWGLSGPAILRLSAWGARVLNDFGYRFLIRINWVPQYHKGSLLALFTEVKSVEGKKTVHRTKAVDVPRRLWVRLAQGAGIPSETRWADISKAQMLKLVEQLTQSEFSVQGKSTFKDEFVTAGGVALSEIDFKTMESRMHKDLYFAGEVIDVDAITGGFNFQNAWTTGFLAAKGIIGQG